MLSVPSDTCGYYECGIEGGGANVGMPAKEVRNLPKKTKATVTEHGKKTVKVVPYQYRTRTSCKNAGANAQDCAPNFGACTSLPDASGPLVNIDRRKVLPRDEYTDWAYVGTTCYATLVPNTDDKPRLTMTMIKNAWRKTPFAKPHASIQPVGNRTLVTIPTYFAIAWPDRGYQPGEVHTVTLLGHTVRIKPTFKSNTFYFGDGATSGPTRSAGGPYPTGDITHAYEDAGTYRTHISTTYGGTFSVDNGAWTTIPGTLTISGPTQQLHVLTAENRLVTR